MKFADYLLQEDQYSTDIEDFKKMLHDNFDSYMSYFRGNGMFYYDETKERAKAKNVIFDSIWKEIEKSVYNKVDNEISNKNIKKGSAEYNKILHDTFNNMMDIKHHLNKQ